MSKELQVYRVQMVRGSMRRYVGVLASSEPKAMKFARAADQDGFAPVSAIIEDDRPVDLIGN